MVFTPPPSYGSHSVENHVFLANWFLKETFAGNPILTFYIPDAPKTMGKDDLDDHGSSSWYITNMFEAKSKVGPG